MAADRVTILIHGTYCPTDYDQCKTHKGLCGDDADCEEKVGGYQCHCHIGAGYEVDPVSKKCVGKLAFRT